MTLEDTISSTGLDAAEEALSGMMGIGGELTDLVGRPVFSKQGLAHVVADVRAILARIETTLQQVEALAKE